MHPIKERLLRLRRAEFFIPSEILTNLLSPFQGSEGSLLDPGAARSALAPSFAPPAHDDLQVQGVLVRIDCAPKAIVLTVKSGDRLLKIKTESFENIDITTFSPDVAGEIQCGPHKPENVVIVCYVPSKDSSTRVDGIVKSIEFVPKDFKLTSDN